jgi:hypothetical protein
MKQDSLFIITAALITLILCGVIYLQHLEIMKLSDRGEWAKMVDRIREPIDHIYIETRFKDKGEETPQ